MVEIYGFWIHINRWILIFFHFISTDFNFNRKWKNVYIKINKFCNHNINKFALKFTFNYLFHRIIKKNYNYLI